MRMNPSSCSARFAAELTLSQYPAHHFSLLLGFLLLRFWAMSSELLSRAARYREISDELWRISTEAGRSISFDNRTRLATLADKFREMADRIEDEIAAD